MNEQTTLDWFLSRRSTREFTDRPVARETIERLLLAATSAPSASNRQPWQFAVVRSRSLRAAIVDAVRERADEMKAIIARGHHADDYGSYGDFFHEPLMTAAVIIIPQYREFPDLIANLLASGGADPSAFHTAGAMQAELCSTSAAVMNLLLQAHASGLGGCWMAGPMIARDRICALLGIAAPWQMVGAIALGYPAGPAPEQKPRKPLGRVARWFEDDHTDEDTQ
ncbi:nitroreductase family protein [Massilia violaceinigra]|uniref:Nitroreductase family protein n=1 Tax=Massilia violaceinigra TaxID=2045208 RepID=A0ABY4A130_9BURK|nr:nitroreductase family protein [Massilia violaceinigra]UOD28411.1 nitroreductase family protein [Massilia violaceinigra]